MVRSITALETENQRLAALIAKKKQEINKAENKIRRNHELISKKQEIQDRTISAYVEKCTLENGGFHTVIRIIDTGETHPYWGHNTPNTYIKITPQWLEQLRDCKRRRDTGEFER